jgi:hypothetical protein
LKYSDLGRNSLGRLRRCLAAGEANACEHKCGDATSRFNCQRYSPSTVQTLDARRGPVRAGLPAVSGWGSQLNDSLPLTFLTACRFREEGDPQHVACAKGAPGGVWDLGVQTGTRLRAGTIPK